MKLSECIVRLQFFQEKFGDKDVKLTLGSRNKWDKRITIHQTINEKDYIEFNFDWVDV